VAACKGLAVAALEAEALALDCSWPCFNRGWQALRDRTEIRSALSALAS
jgi:hypothetical protein